MSQAKIRLGVSSCLLGCKVRFDGGHKHARYLTEVLGDFVDWQPLCPEMEIGLGTPRESLRLEKHEDGVRLVAPKSGSDHSEAMDSWSRERVEILAGQKLRGYVLKKDSPSCGMERVKAYDRNMVPAKDARGFFGGPLVEGLPRLPVEEEGRLNDPRLRENFITRIFAYDRFLKMREAGGGPGELVRFHSAHKMQLLAHHPENYRHLGKLVAQAGEARGEAFEALLDRYEAGFMEALVRLATPGKHVNTIQHLAGFIKDRASAGDKAELKSLTDQYLRGEVPLVVPLTLLDHHLRGVEEDWLRMQSYLDPYPRQLGLRSHV